MGETDLQPSPGLAVSNQEFSFFLILSQLRIIKQTNPVYHSL